MCECPKIHFYEVEFKLDGMIVVPVHKNCGDRLNDKQALEKQVTNFQGIISKFKTEKSSEIASKVLLNHL